jgi:putative phosphoribosyl transferase
MFDGVGDLAEHALQSAVEVLQLAFEREAVSAVDLLVQFHDPLAQEFLKHFGIFEAEFDLHSKPSRLQLKAPNLAAADRREVGHVMNAPAITVTPRPVRLDIAGAALNADLSLPADARGLIVFAHGSGSSRHSSRNRAVAEALQHARLATLLLDLLTEHEDAVDSTTAEFRFDIPLLAGRVVAAIDWAGAHPTLSPLPVGLFGASTGAAAALMAAAKRPDVVRAVVSRGGRPDLAEAAYDVVITPTLLIVGGRDDVVIELNQKAFARLRNPKELQIVPGATHLFEEPGALDQVARLARDWFVRHLANYEL